LRWCQPVHAAALLHVDRYTILMCCDKTVNRCIDSVQHVGHNDVHYLCCLSSGLHALHVLERNNADNGMVMMYAAV
jgi:hypothetical protein